MPTSENAWRFERRNGIVDEGMLFRSARGQRFRIRQAESKGLTALREPCVKRIRDKLRELGAKGESSFGREAQRKTGN